MEMQTTCDFRSFFLGGFECSTHRLANGKRLDLIAATKHDQYCALDYARLRDIGVLSVRDGVRWHLVEKTPYKYDFSSVVPMLKAARFAGIQVIWDVFHYGWPDDLDLLSSEFVPRFASFAHELARVMASETDGVPYFSPVNEISFFSWAAGEAAVLFPFLHLRGNELKAHLVRACIAAIQAIRSVSPGARFVQVDPIINIVTSDDMDDRTKAAAIAHERSQFDAWDMLTGRLYPELGGAPDYLDIVGANYYVHNQWVYGGHFIEAADPRYRPLHEILEELHQRYRRPLFLAETGIEDERRPEWLRYVCDEVSEAWRKEVPVEGICLYPIVNYPGWNDERRCHTGLWDYCDCSGHRPTYTALAEELTRQQVRMLPVRSCM
jgi:beta-glucosidase/6-phospho-beta-glucosidase/beta-galactosidase